MTRALCHIRPIIATLALARIATTSLVGCGTGSTPATTTPAMTVTVIPTPAPSTSMKTVEVPAIVKTKVKTVVPCSCWVPYPSRRHRTTPFLTRAPDYRQAGGKGNWHGRQLDGIGLQPQPSRFQSVSMTYPDDDHKAKAEICFNGYDNAANRTHVAANIHQAGGNDLHGLLDSGSWTRTYPMTPQQDQHPT